MTYQNHWPFDDYQSHQRFRELVGRLKEAPYGGVAFFGAGTSVPVGFPNWTEFHEDFLAHFGAQPRMTSADPDQAMRIDIDYHASREPARSLAFVKDTFATPVPDIPSVVRLARATRSLNYFYTTNFDEILFEAAAGESVAAYPDYMPMTARFLYLHGRASTASSIDELVLGDTGYRRAYDHSHGALAKPRLDTLWSYPVIFIGFSMRDQSVAMSLEQISRAARYRQVNPVAGDAEAAIAPLDWYILLKAPNLTDPRRDEVKRLREDQLSNMSVKVVWYQDGGAPDPHRGVVEVVQGIQRESRDLTVSENAPAFIERLVEAEDIASLESPTSNQVDRAKAILEGHPRIALAFLDRVNGLGWFRNLRDAGALQPKASFVTANGEHRAPHWQVVGFLERVAQIAPTEVKDFLLSVDIDNWFAIRQAFSVLEALDESSGEDLGARYARWAVQAMAMDSHLLLDVSQTAQGLSLGRKREAAQQLVECTLLELAEATHIIPEGNAARFAEAVAPILAMSESGLKTLADGLTIALVRQCGTPEQDNVRYSRPAIEAHRMNLPDHSILGLLIDVKRETLLKTDEAQRRNASITTLLRSKWPTERRIGIAHCSLRRSDLPAHELDIVTKENLANPNLFHELAKLLADGVEDLSDQAIEVVKGFLQTLHEQSAGTERYDYLLWASLLPTELLPESLVRDEEDEDDPESRLFRDFYTSPVFSPGAPLDKGSFASFASSLASDRLLDLVRDPASAGVRVTWRHSTEQMWALLAEYAKEEGALDPLLRISDDDIARHGTWRAIEAMPEIARDDPVLWGKVLDWTDSMIAAVATDKLWALGQLLLSSSKTAPIGLSHRVGALAMALIGRTKRTSELDAQAPGDRLLHGFLNHPAGIAAHSLFELVRRELAESEPIGDSCHGVPEWFSSAVLQPMARESMALGVDAWIGLGRFYSLLLGRSPDAVAFVPSHLRSESPDLSVTARAFWSGHLWTPFVSSAALQHLQEAYRVHAPILGQQGVIEDDLASQFFQHVVIGALRDIHGYDDLLMSTLGDHFRPETRGSITFSLGRGLHEVAEEPGTPLQERAKDWFVRYWAGQVDRRGGQDGPQLAKYLLWLSDLGLPPSEIANLIEASLVQAENSFDVDETFKYLERHVEQEPAIVLRLLDNCVEWYRLHGDFWLKREDVQSLLHRIAPLTSTDPTLREVVEGFTELGALTTDDVSTLLSSDGI